MGDELSDVERLTADSAIGVWLNEMVSLNQADLMRRLRKEFTAQPKPTNVLYITQFWANMSNKKNRYADIPCLDKTRVRLRRYGNDYIHANWVNLPDALGKLIIAQAPMENTVYDFWKMILDEEVRLIVSLTMTFEREVEKCFPYWPIDVSRNGILQFQDIMIRNVHYKRIGACVISKLVVKDKTNKRKELRHILYVDWPDHKVPTCTHNFIGLLKICDELMSNVDDNEEASTLIHCSAGVGRSGTLVALLILNRQILNGTAPDIHNLVKTLREQRAMAVQRIEQYTFIYRTAIELAYNIVDGPDEMSDATVKQLKLLRALTTRSKCDLKVHRRRSNEADKEMDVKTAAITEQLEPTLQRRNYELEANRRSPSKRSKSRTLNPTKQSGIKDCEDNSNSKEGDVKTAATSDNIDPTVQRKKSVEMDPGKRAAAAAPKGKKSKEVEPKTFADQLRQLPALRAQNKSKRIQPPADKQQPKAAGDEGERKTNISKICQLLPPPDLAAKAKKPQQQTSLKENAKPCKATEPAFSREREKSETLTAVEMTVFEVRNPQKKKQDSKKPRRRFWF